MPGFETQDGVEFVANAGVPCSPGGRQGLPEPTTMEDELAKVRLPRQMAFDASQFGTTANRLAALSVYPNPAMDTLGISWQVVNDAGPYRITVYDAMGRAVLHKISASTSAHLDVFTLPSGVYHLSATGARHKAQARWIKQ